MESKAGCQTTKSKIYTVPAKYIQYIQGKKLAEKLWMLEKNENELNVKSVALHFNSKYGLTPSEECTVCVHFYMWLHKPQGCFKQNASF